jgi:hypothetical protein
MDNFYLITPPSEYRQGWDEITMFADTEADAMKAYCALYKHRGTLVAYRLHSPRHAWSVRQLPWPPVDASTLTDLNGGAFYPVTYWKVSAPKPGSSAEKLHKLLSPAVSHGPRVQQARPVVSQPQQPANPGTEEYDPDKDYGLE